MAQLSTTISQAHRETALNFLTSNLFLESTGRQVLEVVGVTCSSESISILEEEKNFTRVLFAIVKPSTSTRASSEARVVIETRAKRELLYVQIKSQSLVTYKAIHRSSLLKINGLEIRKSFI
jgi:hypothetical protein